MSNRYAIVENGVVVNVEMHDTPPSNGYASNDAGIGDTYDGMFFRKTEVISVDPNREIMAQLAELDSKTTRPLREITAAILSGSVPNPIDVKMLSELKTQADILRSKLVPV